MYLLEKITIKEKFDIRHHRQPKLEMCERVRTIIMMVKGNKQITRNPIWLFEHIDHRDDYIIENNIPLYGTLLFLVPAWFYDRFCQFKLLPFGPHVIFQVPCLYIYHFPVETLLLRSFLIHYAEICHSMHIISRSETKICQENLFH